MKNPFKNIKSKTKKAMSHKITRIAVSTTVATIAGTAASVGVAVVTAKAPIHIGVRLLAQLVAYTVTSTITHEVVSNELEVDPDYDLGVAIAESIIPKPPKV